MIKNLIKTAALWTVALAAWAGPFSDGFEAHASTCWSNVYPTTAKAANSTDPAVKVSQGSLVCLNGNQLEFNCKVLTNGKCETVTVVTPPVDPPVTPPSTCDLTPPGWSYAVAGTGTAPTFSTVFQGATAWRSPSYLVPVGSFTGRTSSNPSGVPMTGKIVAFKEKVGAANVRVQLAGAQPVPPAGYGGGYNAKYAAFSVSKCKGDIAPMAWGAKDKCIGFTGSLEARLIFGPTALNGCKFPKGSDVWVHFWFPDANAPLDPTKNGCDPSNYSAGTKCNVNVSVQ